MSAWKDLTPAQQRVLIHEVWELDENLGLNLTGNYERIQDGVHLYEIDTWADALAEFFFKIRDAK